MTIATPHLLQLLEAARKRLRAQALLEAALIALIWAFPLAAAILAAAALAEVPLEPWQVMAAAGGPALVIMIIRLASRPWPSLQTAARLLDRRLEARELFSSAYQTGRSGAGGAVAEALQASAERAAQATKASAVIPLQLRRPVLALACSIGVSFLAVQLFGYIQPQASASSPGAAVSPRIDLAEDLRAMADFVQRRADEEDDLFVAAIASALQELGEQAADAATVDGTALPGQLEALRDYAERAVSSWSEPQAQSLTALMDSLVEQARKPAATSSASADGGPTAPDASLPTENAFRQQLAAVEAGENLASAPIDPYEDERHEDAYDYEQMQVAATSAESSDQNPPSTTTGAPAAPSNDATGGASAMAGDGTGELNELAAGAMPVEFESAGEMELESIDQGGGLRTEEIIVPPTQLARAVSATDPSLGANWSRQGEARVQRHAVPADERDVVSRYRLGIREAEAQ